MVVVELRAGGATRHAPCGRGPGDPARTMADGPRRGLSRTTSAGTWSRRVGLCELEATIRCLRAAGDAPMFKVPARLPTRRTVSSRRHPQSRPRDDATPQFGGATPSSWESGRWAVHAAKATLSGARQVIAVDRYTGGNCDIAAAVGATDCVVADDDSDTVPLVSIPTASTWSSMPPGAPTASVLAVLRTRARALERSWTSAGSRTRPRYSAAASPSSGSPARMPGYELERPLCREPPRSGLDACGHPQLSRSRADEAMPTALERVRR